MQGLPFDASARCDSYVGKGVTCATLGVWLRPSRRRVTRTTPLSTSQARRSAPTPNRDAQEAAVQADQGLCKWVAWM